jgi:hypothetical protein
LGLLDAKYDYVVEVYPSQQVPYWVLPLDEEEVKKVALPVEEYQPSNLSQEKAIQRAIEESELLELGQWVGLGELQASASMSRAAPPPPPPPAPEPQVG